MHTVEQHELAIAGVEGREPQQIRMVFSAGPDRRRYNRPTHCDVAAVFVGHDGKPGPQEFCVYPKADDILQTIIGRLHRFRSNNTCSGPITGVNNSDLNNMNPDGFPINELLLKVGCKVRLLKAVGTVPTGSRVTVTSIFGTTITCNS